MGIRLPACFDACHTLLPCGSSIAKRERDLPAASIMLSAFGIFMMAVVVPWPAIAQTATAAPAWRLDVGTALQLGPRYLGSDETRYRIFPYIDAAWRDFAFATIRDGRARADLIAVRYGAFYSGGEVSLLFGQNADAARLPTGWGNIGATADIGLVAGIQTRAFRFEGRLRQGLTGHKAVTAEISAAVSFPIPGTLRYVRPTIVSLGPRMNYGAPRYAERYFGIDTARAVRTRLAPYDAGTFWAWGANAVLIQPLWRSFNLVGAASYTRLTGDAGRSPIVRERGNVSAIVSITWRFEP